MSSTRATFGVPISLAILASVASADLLTFDGFGAGSFPHPRLTSRGGEFRVTTDNLGAFRTFCIEVTERAVIGDTFTYEIDTGSRRGSEPSGFDPLSFESAWLYLHYRDGTLDDLVPAYGYGDNTSSDALQEAFWELEDEPLPGSTSALAQTLMDAATVGAAGWTHLHGVRVLVLTDDGDLNAQDVLGVIPAPGAALLALIGLQGIRAVRRTLG